jgi:signal transduction histidine kinase
MVSLTRSLWLRESALLAVAAAVTASLDRLLSGALPLGQPGSMLIALLLALLLCAGARPWLLEPFRSEGALSMEQMFDRLYRMTRDVESHPERAPACLLALLRELFEPLEAAVLPRPGGPSTASGDGSTLRVPVPDLTRPGGPAGQTLELRLAQQGRRLFNREDARLADRIVEQLRRAVAFDHAVERGRCEERVRLAQDLHDDIGARLLTLMYQAQSPEHEDYIRHTLQDLKTLTRGLVASSHRLSDAAGEWKADLQQRLQLAHVGLDWQIHFEQDAELGVVAWSGLTRVLRELVSNTIAHSRATQVWATLRLENDRLEITVRDDGIGRNPKAWSQGLGLGGIHKRVRQLGGEVEWCEVQPRGIECRVLFSNWSQAANAAPRQA